MVEEAVKMKLEEIPIDKIDIGEGNVRNKELSKKIDELKKSIQLIGLQQPPIAFRKGDRYELIVGQRRFIAVSQLGWKKIPLLIRDPLNLTESKIISLSENLLRVKLSARDMSDVCNYLLEKLGTPQKVVDALGVSYPTVSKYLGYKIVPEPIKKIVEKEKNIKATDAIKIVERCLPDEEKAVRLIKKLAEDRMTGPEKERVIDALEEAPKEPVEQVLKRAKEARVQKEIIIILPEKYLMAIDKASEKLEMAPEDVAKKAVTEWLQNEGYVTSYE